ncbi:MAG: SurA N-terminal domain-containing protein, partial [Vicinamibacterales bacterium]
MPRLTLAFRNRSRPRLIIASAFAAAFFAATCRSTPAPSKTTVTADTWAVVNGQEIARDHVEKAYRRSGDPSQTLSNEEALTAKLSLLNDLIIQEILIAKARELKVELPESELDTAYADARKNT